MSAAFAFGTATAKDIQTVLITRFFAGVFGSSPISITGGSIVDIWTPRQRGTPMVCYGVTIAAAPTLGPIIGGALVASGCGWRWTEYLTAIVMMVQFVVDAIWLDESHADILLTRKASHLRQVTRNFALHAKVGTIQHEVVLGALRFAPVPFLCQSTCVLMPCIVQWEETSPTFKSLLGTYLIRPFQMLLNPICLLLTIYTSFVYGKHCRCVKLITLFDTLCPDSLLTLQPLLSDSLRELGKFRVRVRCTSWLGPCREPIAFSGSLNWLSVRRCRQYPKQHLLRKKTGYKPL